MLASARRLCFGIPSQRRFVGQPGIKAQYFGREQHVNTALKTSGQICYNPITSPSFSWASRFFLSKVWA